MELINQTATILTQSAELMKNPAVSGAVTGLFSWLKNLFSNNKRAKERLELIEKMQANEEDIEKLKTNLDDLLYENQEIKKMLEEKIKEIEKVMQKEGIQTITKTNTMNITGNNNIGLQDFKGGDININTNK